MTIESFTAAVAFPRSDGRLERGDAIGPFPWEDIASEMSVGRRVAVAPTLGFRQAQVGDKRVGAEVEHLAGKQNLFEPGVVHAMVRAERLDADGHGTIHADCVGHLNLAAVGKSGGDDVLGGVACVVGGAAIDLGGILAREGATAVRGHAAIRIDDDLASGQARIAGGAAHDELAGGVDVELRPRRQKFRLGELCTGDLLQFGVAFPAGAGFSGLVGEDDRLDGHGPSVFVGDGKLALGVRAQIGQFVGLAQLGEVEQKAAEIPAPPVGNVMTARTAKAGRVMTLMDGTVITNIVERPFKRDLEHSLWVALRPGNMGAGLLTTLQNRHSEHEIIEMLKEMTVPEEGDSEGMIRIKQEVQELKEKILIELDSGRSLSDVFDEIRNQGVAESKIKADTMRLRAEAIRSGDPEQVRETVRRANEIRAKQGLEPLTVPEEFQSPEEDAPAKQTYTEFEDEEENS